MVKSSYLIYMISFLLLSLTYRSLLVTLMIIELVLLSLNLNFILFSIYLDDIYWQFASVLLLIINPHIFKFILILSLSLKDKDFKIFFDLRNLKFLMVFSKVLDIFFLFLSFLKNISRIIAFFSILTAFFLNFTPSGDQFSSLSGNFLECNCGYIVDDLVYLEEILIVIVFVLFSGGRRKPKKQRKVETPPRQSNAIKYGVGFGVGVAATVATGVIYNHLSAPSDLSEDNLSSIGDGNRSRSESTEIAKVKADKKADYENLTKELELKLTEKLSERTQSKTTIDVKEGLVTHQTYRHPEQKPSDPNARTWVGWFMSWVA